MVVQLTKMSREETDVTIGCDTEKGAEVMPSREPLSLRATDHGVIPKEYTNEGRTLLLIEILMKRIINFFIRIDKYISNSIWRIGDF